MSNAADDACRRRRPPSVLDGWKTVPRDAIEELLLLAGYVFELREVGRTTALRSFRSLFAGQLGATADPTEIVNSVIAQGLRGEHGLWSSRNVPTGRRLVAALCGSPFAEVPDLAQLPPKRFGVALRRSFNLARVPVGSDVRLRMPLPVEDAHLKDLDVVVEPSAADVRMDPGRIEAKLAAADSENFSLAASLSFTARPGLPHGADEPAAGHPAWLGAREGPIQITAAVRVLAERIDRPAAAPFDRVMAFRDHLIDTMASGMIHSEALAGQAATDWVLERRWYDCRLGAALLVALCRACRIPARLIGGYLLWEAPMEHYWMEAWLPDRGWTPFDLLAWDLSAGGQDRDWRNIFAGAVDYRMKTQVFPDLFTGAPGVPMGEAWHRLPRAIPDGVETRFVSIPDGELIYADEIRVFRD